MGLVDTRIDNHFVTQLCDRCNASFTSTVIPLPSKQCQYLDYVPSALEISQIYSDIAEEEDQLKVFNIEINRIRAAWDRLAEARHRLSVRIARRKGLLSVTRRLPAEIWQMIFARVGALREYSLDSIDYEPRPLGLGYAPYRILSIPLTLSRVCRHWKKIVDTTPALWTSIRIKLSKVKGDIRPLLAQYFKKSGTQPLKISCAEWRPDPQRSHMFQFDHHEPFSPIQEQCFFSLIAGAASRCEELELRFGNKIPQPSQPIEFPNLRLFQSELSPSHDDTDEDDVLWLYNSLGCTSYLTHLLIHHLQPDKFQATPTQSLQHLEIQLAHDDFHFRRMLQQCTSLKSLIIRTFGFLPPDPEQNIDRVHLPNLRRLTLGSFDEPISFAGFFDAFSAPCLTELKLIFDLITWDDDIELNETSQLHFPRESLDAMLKRHSSSLRKLYLTILRDEYRPVLLEFSLVEILQAVPDLTHLRCGLDAYDAADLEPIETLIPALQYSAASPPGDVLVPRLEEISVVLAVRAENHIPIKERAIGLGQPMIETAESRSKAAAAGAVTRLETLCVSMTSEDRIFGLRAKEEDWKGMISDESLCERTQALLLDGTTCFLGSLRDFSSRSDGGEPDLLSHG